MTPGQRARAAVELVDGVWCIKRALAAGLIESFWAAIEGQIRQAIKTEREGCAKLAETVNGVSRADVAAAIRARTT